MSTVKTKHKLHAMTSLLESNWGSTEEASMLFDLLMQAKTEEEVDAVAKAHGLQMQDHLLRANYSWADATCYLLDLAVTQQEMAETSKAEKKLKRNAGVTSS